jgi:P-type Mg2+ transporter
MDESVQAKVADLQQKLNSDGLRVIAVACKTIPLEQSHCAIADESDLILLGHSDLLLCANSICQNLVYREIWV